MAQEGAADVERACRGIKMTCAILRFWIEDPKLCFLFPSDSFAFESGGEEADKKKCETTATKGGEQAAETHSCN